MTRIIPCTVANEYVKGSGVSVGAAGSHDDVVLELRFAPFWEGLSKKITWLDANGENPTMTVLTSDMLKEGETDVYLVPIPAKPKRVAGKLTMTIKGAQTSGTTETRATLSTSCTFTVLPSAFDEDGEEQGDVPATIADQLQTQIEAIKGDIVQAGKAADAKEAAEASATEAAQSAAEALTATQQAAHSASAAQNAYTDAMSAKQAAQAAQTAAETAESNAEQYSADALDYRNAAQAAVAGAAAEHAAALEARTGAENARDAAMNAKIGAEAAKTAAESARDTAQSAAANAESAKSAAHASQTAAKNSENKAKEYMEQAGEIVGGDYATHTEVTAAIATAEAYTDEQIAAIPPVDISGKADLVDGKVPASQLPEMDYDPSGSAASALAAAQAYTDAQITAAIGTAIGGSY